jgi:hypothetical protein
MKRKRLAILYLVLFAAVTLVLLGQSKSTGSDEADAIRDAFTCGGSE